jgi:putative ABC transport system permease protein
MNPQLPEYQEFQAKQVKMNIISGAHRMPLTDLFRLSLRVFRVRPLRTFLTILGISLGIGAVLFLVSLGYGLQYILIGKLAATEDSLISLEAFYPSESNLFIAKKDVDKILSIKDAAEASLIGEFTGEAKVSGLSGFLMVRVVDSNYFRLSGLKVDIGDIFREGQKSVVVSNSALKLLNLKEDEGSLNKEISLKVFYQEDDKSDVKIAEIKEPLRISGIITNEAEQPLVIVSASYLSVPPPFYQRVFVKARDINTVESLKDSLIKEGFLISARIDLVNQAKKILTIITTVLGIFGATALLVSAIGMFNTMVIGFLERIFEVGIMKSLGATVQDIRNLFLMESLIIGILGGIGGILIGVGAGEFFNFGLNILAKNLGGKPIKIFIYPVQFMFFIVILSGLVGILAGFWPARRAAQLSPKEAFRNK